MISTGPNDPRIRDLARDIRAAGRRLAERIGEHVDDEEAREAIIRALDELVAPKDPIREMLSDLLIRALVDAAYTVGERRGRARGAR